MSGLTERIVAQENWPALTRETADDFLAPPGAALIFVRGLAAQRPETEDVAVVLRELTRAYGQALRAAVLDPKDEPALMKRWGVIVVPCLVVLKDGEVLAKLPRIADWKDYTAAITQALDSANQNGRAAE